jgi:hypothetical protein
VKIPLQLSIISLALLAHVPEAHAYLDPGTGSLLLQGILALIAGAAVTLKLYWGKFKSFFVRDRVSAADTHDERR